METTPRKRGGQPGNKNALKHGFYSAAFTDGENADLATMTPHDLVSEINMLRVSLRRTFAQLAKAKDLDSTCVALMALGQTSTRLANMLKTQLQLRGSGSEAVEIMDQELGDVPMAPDPHD